MPSRTSTGLPDQRHGNVTVPVRPPMYTELSHVVNVVNQTVPLRPVNLVNMYTRSARKGLKLVGSGGGSGSMVGVAVVTNVRRQTKNYERGKG